MAYRRFLECPYLCSRNYVGYVAASLGVTGGYTQLFMHRVYTICRITQLFIHSVYTICRMSYVTGIIYAAASLGVAGGYMAGSQFLNIYTDVDRVDLAT